MSILSGIAQALGGVIQSTVIPGFGNVIVTLKRDTRARNQANESVSQWSTILSGLKMRVEVLSADDVIKAWGATSGATASGIISGRDAPDVRTNDVILVTQVLEGKFPITRWKIEDLRYSDAAQMWEVSLTPHLAVQPTS